MKVSGNIMKTLLIFSVLPILATCFVLSFQLDSNTTSEHSERECGSSFEKLWLDIVFVVDNSAGMTNEGLAKVSANMKSVLEGVTIGLRSWHQTTRVGLITYNREATVVAGLNTFTSYDDFSSTVTSTLSQVSSEELSDLAAGFSEASALFDRWHLDSRKQFQKVVILYTNIVKYTKNFGFSPLTEANNLKEKKVQIITVAMNDDDTLNALLSTYATLPFDFNIADADLKGEIQNALLAVNCFCPSGGWVQYRDTYGDFTSKKYAVCIYPSSQQLLWVHAMRQCYDVNRYSYLLNEYSVEKHNFSYEVIKAHGQPSHPYRYHIGLAYYNNAWTWESTLGLNGNVADFTYWNAGFPVADNNKVVVMNVETSDGSRWENANRVLDYAYFACETRACDVDNYCDTSVA